MEIIINNQVVVVYLFFFFISYFFTYLFLKANLFFKIIVFFISFSVFIQLENSDSLPLTVVSILGAIVAFIQCSERSILDIGYSVKGFFSGLNNFIAGCFDFLRKIIEAILLIKSFIQEKIDNNGNHHNENSRQQSSNSRQQNEAPSHDNPRTEQGSRKHTRPQQEYARNNNKAKQAHTKEDVRSFEEILGVTTPYTRESVKIAYKKLCQRYHPDKVQSHMSEAYRKESAEEFKRIQKAYKILLGRLEG